MTANGRAFRLASSQYVSIIRAYVPYEGGFDLILPGKTLGAGAQIFVDAADTLAEDHGIAPVGKLIRSLLKHVKDTKGARLLMIAMDAQLEGLC